MPRAKKTETPGAGHNRVLTDEEIADLQFYYEQKIRADEKRAAVAKAAYDEVRQDVNAWFAKVKGDLRYSRKEFEAYLADRDLSTAEFLAKEAKRTALYMRGSMPIGTQMSLDLGGDTVTDQQMAEADGRRAYLRGDDPTPPAHVSPVMHPDWMKGWQEEQAATAERMGRAETLIAERAEPEPEDDGEEDADPDGEDKADEPDLSEGAVAAAARRVRRSKFMERGTSGGEVDQPAAA
jgi:hypothetical protein